MGLSLKYVVLTNAGTWHYRRRAPKAARTTFPQSEFKRLLGDTRREALRNWPHVHAEFERVTNSDKSSPKESCTNEQHSNPDTVPFEQRITPPTQDPTSAKQAPKPSLKGIEAETYAPTLADAKQLYLQERIIGDINERHKTARLERVMGHLHAVIKPDCPLSQITRSHAREVRDRMLTERKMSPITVKRYLSDVSAMVNLGLREFDIRGAINPFLNLPIKIDTVAREERDPLPVEVLTAMQERLSTHAAPDIWNIWQIVEGTGCRLGEVTGLLRSDVHIDGDIPYIDLVFHTHRRLKTNGSIRRVPLLGFALKAAQNALRESTGSIFLFPRYGRVRGADSASAALMKHLRAISNNPKHTIHSLRHSMEDKLTRAGVSEFDRNLVLGHSSGSMSERYGGAEARLKIAHKAILCIHN